jgi:hypothetical protein
MHHALLAAPTKNRIHEAREKNKKKSPKPKNPSEKALSARKGAYEARDVRKRKKQRRHRLGGSKTSKCMCGFVGVRGAQPRHMLAQSAI